MSCGSGHTDERGAGCENKNRLDGSKDIIRHNTTTHALALAGDLTTPFAYHHHRHQT